MTRLFKYCPLLLKMRVSSSADLKLLPPSLQGDTTAPCNIFLGSSNLFVQSTFQTCSTSKATISSFNNFMNEYKLIRVITE